MGKRTPLYQDHVSLGGRIVEFGGWEMPVQYSGLADEHNTCRTTVGLFDVSHMGEILVTGARSLDYLNRLVTNNVSKIKDNQAQYTVMCYDDGGCVDDLIIHRVKEDSFLICVNASNTEKDFSWMKEHAPKDLTVRNVSDHYAQIAVQGKNALDTLQPHVDVDLASIKYYWFREGKVCDQRSFIARTGYTGEDGFEVYVPSHTGSAVWNALLESGSKFQIKPCGLGARDTLRTEMKFPLYGHEIDEKLNPIEAGLGWVVKLEKPNFHGHASLVSIKESGLNKSLVGLRTIGKAIPRQGYRVEFEGKDVGYVTSGTMSPSLKQGIAIAYVDSKLSAAGNKFDVVIRDQRVEHELVETPFYKRPY